VQDAKGTLEPSEAPDMVEIEAALALIAQGLGPIGSETVSLDGAHGRVCAEAITARLDAPPFAVAAMDGYAVRCADFAPGTVMRCLAHAKAGDRHPSVLVPGTCTRIFTGAPVPAGGDAVVLQEDARSEEAGIRFTTAPVPGRHIRLAGCNFRTGDVVVRAGRRLGARDVGLLAAAGHQAVRVHQRPRVAILSTGDELSDRFVTNEEPQIIDANRPALKALVRAWGGVAIDLGIARDCPTALGSAIHGVEADLLVVSGGASVGDFDLVRPTLEGLGLRMAFRRVHMRPGKATMFGTMNGMPVLSLPGNAVAALVSALVFLKPILSALEGAGYEALACEPAILAHPMTGGGPRNTFLRGRLDRRSDGSQAFAAQPIQDNAMISGLAEANALVLRPAGAPALEAGAPIEAIRFDLIAGF
jgi:molybdopterin molybdotransferase